MFALVEPSVTTPRISVFGSMARRGAPGESGGDPWLAQRVTGVDQG